MSKRLVLTPHHPAVTQLIRALGIETERLKRFVLTVDVEQVVQAELLYFPEEPVDADAPAEVIRKHGLLFIESEAAA